MTTDNRPMTDSNSVTVCRMYLCETERLFLKAGQLYRFEVHPTCVRCQEMKVISEHGTEPAPAEQPRSEHISEGGNLSSMAYFAAAKEAKQEPVAASPAEGPRLDHKELSDFNLLHRLWTKAVGTEGYVKDEWRRMESIVLRAEKSAAQPSPDAVKVAAEKIAERFPVEPGDFSVNVLVADKPRLYVEEIAAIIRRYFPQVSAPSRPLCHVCREPMTVKEWKCKCGATTGCSQGVGLAGEATQEPEPSDLECQGEWCKRTHVAICGGTVHATPEEMHGCGREVSFEEMYRCSECDVPFHKQCIKRHFNEHSAQAAPEGAAPPESLEDQWAARYLTQLRNAIFATIPEDQKSANSSDDALVAWPGKLAAEVAELRAKLEEERAKTDVELEDRAEAAEAQLKTAREALQEAINEVREHNAEYEHKTAITKIANWVAALESLGYGKEKA